MKLRTLLVVLAILIVIVIIVFALVRRPERAPRRSINLPSTKALYLPAPGHPQPTNSFPTAVALSPNGRYLAILNNGYGTEQSAFQQSIAILDLSTHKVADFPDSRLGQHAGQTYYLGLAFSRDGSNIYASMSSLTDPLGKKHGDTGNGIAVYRFQDGRIAPERFIEVPLAPVSRGKKSILESKDLPKGSTVSYPAGLTVLPGIGGAQERPRRGAHSKARSLHP